MCKITKITNSKESIMTDKINNIIYHIRRRQNVKIFALIDLAKYEFENEKRKN